MKLIYKRKKVSKKKSVSQSELNLKDEKISTWGLIKIYLLAPHCDNYNTPTNKWLKTINQFL